jgi:hypothetical protein
MMFLAGGGEWTEKISDAQGFATLEAALAARESFHLQDCELYYSFSDYRATEYDFSVALLDGTRHLRLAAPLHFVESLYRVRD